VRPSLTAALSIFELDVVPERWRQLRAWPDRSLPDGTARSYDYQALTSARHLLGWFRDEGWESWRDVLLVVMREAFIESEPEPLRAALARVAATSIAWIEDIDRRQPARIGLPEIIDDLVATVTVPA
jgi:hypothetical protein